MGSNLPSTYYGRWLKAQVRAESAFNARAKSHVGAMGLVQAMPATWKEWMPADSDPYNPEHALIFQARYMQWLYDKLPHLDKATAAYNAGIGRITNYGDSWRELMPTETKQYVRRIRNYYQEYTQ